MLSPDWQGSPTPRPPSRQAAADVSRATAQRSSVSPDEGPVEKGFGKGSGKRQAEDGAVPVKKKPKTDNKEPKAAASKKIEEPAPKAATLKKVKEVAPDTSTASTNLPAGADEVCDIWDVWWSDEMGRALKRVSKDSKDTVQISERLVPDNGAVYAVFEGGFRWRVPHLVASDLGKGKLPPLAGAKQKAVKGNPKGKAKTKAKAKPQAEPQDSEQGTAEAPEAEEGSKPKGSKKAKPMPKPVQDYCLKSIRCKYTTQGSNPPIVKVEVNEDRFEATGKWQQKMQLVIKDKVTPNVAMHVAMTFADCFHHMLLVPDRIDYRECRNALLSYPHDWEASPLSWKVVNDQVLAGFPPALLLGSNAYKSVIMCVNAR